MENLKLKIILILILSLAGLILMQHLCPADDNTSFFGMEIESVTGNTDQVTITTTGAEYVLNSTGMEMWRRIDPHTNTNTTNPIKVAELSFNTDIGELQIQSPNKREANIFSNLADFQFNSDSFFFITAKTPFSYTHTNLITGASWNKPEQEFLESGLDKMWTNGSGGSLHAWINGTSKVIANDTDYTTINMSANDQMAHMVFPPKTYDFERLYGEGARPFIYIQTARNLNHTAFPEDLPTEAQLDQLKAEGFGVILLYNDFYRKISPDYTEEQYFPYWLDSEGVYGYEYSHPTEIAGFIVAAQNKSFRVLAYMQPGKFNPSIPPKPPEVFNNQDVNTTLQWMRDFQKKYKLDGWYLDGGCINHKGTYLLSNYNFIRQVRNDIDAHAEERGFDRGIIYHHSSLDAWDYTNFRGLTAIMINAYVDYTLTGEIDYTVNNNLTYKGFAAQVDDPNDPYLRFYTCGYGTSQAYATYVRITNNRAAISVEEYARAMGQNFNGIERVFYVDSIENALWSNYFKPAYQVRKEQYEKSLRGEGTFNPYVDWPINETTGWFRAPKNIRVVYPLAHSVTISWQTDEPADSKVAYTSNGIWWLPDGPDGEISQDSGLLVTEHNVTIENLVSGQIYEFRIRSSNNLPVPEEIIWGEVITLPLLYGDVNDDKQISAYDAGLAARLAVGLNHADIKSPAAAEVSGDGEVTAYDAALIAQRAVCLIAVFPVEE